MVEYIRQNNVDCDLWVGDTLDVPVTPEVAAAAKTNFERFKAAGGNVSHIKVTHDPVEAQKVDPPPLYSLSESNKIDITHQIRTSLLRLVRINPIPLETNSTYNAREPIKGRKPANTHQSSQNHRNTRSKPRILEMDCSNPPRPHQLQSSYPRHKRIQFRPRTVPARAHLSLATHVQPDKAAGGIRRSQPRRIN